MTQNTPTHNFPQKKHMKNSHVLTLRMEEDDRTILETYNVDVKFRSLVKDMDKPKTHRFLFFGKPKPQIFYDVPEFPSAC